MVTLGVGKCRRKEGGFVLMCSIISLASCANGILAPLPLVSNALSGVPDGQTQESNIRACCIPLSFVLPVLRRQCRGGQQVQPIRQVLRVGHDSSWHASAQRLWPYMHSHGNRPGLRGAHSSREDAVQDSGHMSTDKGSPEDGAGMPAVEEEAEEELGDEGVVESKMKVKGGTLYIVATP